MITLENSELSVSILHPEHDRARLGPRFCTGGYVYQVDDKRLGPLLSGPEYPLADPSVINGQGMPEVFQYTLFDDPDACPAEKLIIGVGVIDNAVGQKASDNHFMLPVSEFCRWEIETDADSVSMRTRQLLGDHALYLRRTLRLRDRSLWSTTHLINTGPADLMFRWFAHPFFPRMAGDEACKPGFSFTLPEGDAFYLDEAKTIRFDPSYDWPSGRGYQLLEDVEGKHFGVRQRHPLCTEVRVDGDFLLHKVALWANENTFSIEPFLQHTLPPGGEYTWTLSYRF